MRYYSEDIVRSKLLTIAKNIINHPEAMKDYKVWIETSLNDERAINEIYWKQRCLLAEKVIETVNSNGGTLSYDVEAKQSWQSLKQSLPTSNEQEDKLWDDVVDDYYNECSSKNPDDIFKWLESKYNISLKQSLPNKQED